MATTKKSAKTASKAKADKPAKKATHANAETKTAKVQKAKAKEAPDTAVKAGETLSKIQCFAPGKKLICANLILADHKCMAKKFQDGRLATVRPGKKRRCEFYHETAFQAS